MEDDKNFAYSIWKIQPGIYPETLDLVAKPNNKAATF